MEETNTLTSNFNKSWDYFYMDTIIDIMLWTMVIGVTAGVVVSIHRYIKLRKNK